jgi:hypothetical protein
MLRSHTYKNAHALLKPYFDKGQHVIPTAGGVLAELNLAADTPINTDKTTRQQDHLVRPSEQAILSKRFSSRLDSIVDTTVGDSEHSARLIALSDDLSKVISQHLNIAKNVVAPDVKAFADQLIVFSEKTRPHEPSEDFCVIEGSIPPFIFDESLLHRFEYSDPDKIDSVEPVKVIPESITIEKALSLLEHGGERLTKEIRAWASTLCPIFLTSIVAHNFYGGGDLDPKNENKYQINGSLEFTGNNVYDKLTIATVIYVVASHLLNNPIGDSGLTDHQYKTKLQKAIDNASVFIQRFRNQAQSSSASGYIVHSANSYDKTITVNKQAYDAYLANGGSVELLFGIVVSGKPYSRAEDILAHKEELSSAWNAYTRLSYNNDESAYIRSLHTYIEATALEAVRNPNDLEKAYREKTGTTVAEVEAKVLEQIKLLEGKLHRDLYHTALHIVAKGRYFFTGGYDILKEMAIAELQDSETDPREAAFISAAKYIAKFLVTQISPVKR